MTFIKKFIKKMGQFFKFLKYDVSRVMSRKYLNILGISTRSSSFQ
jgi:hypothetical protein